MCDPRVPGVPGVRPPPGILPNGYNPPDGFCWDQSCDDPPIMDDPDLEDYNVDDVVQRFTAIAKQQVRHTHGHPRTHICIHTDACTLKIAKWYHVFLKFRCIQIKYLNIYRNIFSPKN